MPRRTFEKMDKSCGNMSLSALNLDKTDFAERAYETSSEHPTPEQLLMREAAKFLTPKQKKVWELYNYDRLTQDEMAARLGMGQANVAHSIKAIEKRIAKWVASNMGAYKLLKQDYSDVI
jgi:DNA-directed RNA polymerase specialized sigma subunit